MSAFIDDRAVEASDESDVNSDDELGGVNGDSRKKKINGAAKVNGDGELDSSDESSEEGEEAEREVREGFIDDDEDDGSDGRRHRKLKRKRKHRAEAEEFLDEEDLDLIGETQGGGELNGTPQSRFKRIRRGHEQPEALNIGRSLGDIFNDELQTPKETHGLLAGLGNEDEFADFISDDDVSEGEKQRRREEDEIQAPKQRRKRGINNRILENLGEEVADMMKQAFETNEYDWALELEEEMEAKKKEDQELALSDVFDPSSLKANLMTVEDNIIRSTDIPERFQIARAPYPNLDISDEDIMQEADWIMKQMLAKRPQMKANLSEPFRESIQQVLDFIIRQNFEVPFIFQHRKDYLIHAEKIPKAPNPDRPNESAGYLVKAEKLLNQNDLWEIFHHDIKWRAFLHKRRQILHLFNTVRPQVTEEPEVDVEELCRYAQSIEELQDLHEYVNFKYAALLGDQTAVNGNGTASAPKLARPGQTKSTVDQVMNSPLYGLVKEFGISADQLGRALLREGRRQFINDPAELPIDLAQKQYTGGAFSTGGLALKAAKMTFAEEIFKSPRVRKYVRGTIYTKGRIDCIRTEKGKHRIDSDHPFYEIKYLRRQTFKDIAQRPILFLKMLKAEEEGLVTIKIYIDRLEEFERDLIEDHFKSDSYNDLAEAWNAQRREVLEGSLRRIFKTITDAAKENLKEICEDVVAQECRQEYIRRLDQAPYRPEGMPAGTLPAVLILSLGNGNPPHQPICWVSLRDDGSVKETGQLGDLARDENARAEFVSIVRRLRIRIEDRNSPPGGLDVIGIAGWGASNKKLLDTVQELITDNNLECSDFPDPHADAEMRQRVDAYIINDETARMYQHSARAAQHHPGISRLHKYCIGVGKYMQSPLLEYIALDDDILSLNFHPAQKYVTQSKLSAALETAAVDMVNLVGLDIEEVIHNQLHRNCLRYICGLGPRKATSFLKAVEQNGNIVETREQLVGDPDRNIVQVVDKVVFMNCSAFLYITYSTVDAKNESEYLDNTRVHPEDYELGRKMAADALELDELDIQDAQQTGGLGAVVRRLVDSGEEDKVNDLILEEYAEQLELRYNQKKRATLETIRAELQAAFEELRPPFQISNDEEIFTMLTGESVESLDRGDVVAVKILAAKVRPAENELEVVARLDCGVEGFAKNEGLPSELPPDVRLSALFPTGAIRNAKIIDLDRRNFKAALSFIEEDLRHRRQRNYDPLPDEWDFEQLRLDDEESKREINKTTRSNRIIKHAMFRPFNKTQAEEYLGTMNRGDYVIRPSSKGMDHLVITWKVADNVFGHIDVLERQKDNDFTLGKMLVVNGTAYSDLDELIVEHVYGMVRQVELMMNHERYHGTSRTQVEAWLTTYIEANPRRAMYAFCLNPQYPGYFWLCWKSGPKEKVQAWSVKVVPKAFELKQHKYPDVESLKDGFKTLMIQGASGKAR